MESEENKGSEQSKGICGDGQRLLLSWGTFHVKSLKAEGWHGAAFSAEFIKVWLKLFGEGVDQHAADLLVFSC